jgi:outer membrane protein OmpA-like peptidoglycan-associated protein
MSKKRIDPALIVALVVTAIMTGGLAIGGLWAVSRVSDGSVSIPGTSQSDRQEAGQLLVLGDTFSGYSTFRNVAFQDALNEVGITLAYEDEFDQAARADRLSQGEADVIVTTLDQFLQQQPQGRIVGLIDRTVGADAVILNTPQYQGLTSLQDLSQLAAQARSQGQPLGMAYAGDTPSEYLALVLDTKFEGFNLSDFEITEVADASEAWQLMQDPNQSIAIAVIWEPFVSQARQQGYTIVLSSGDAPGSIVDVVVASDRLLNSKPELVSEFLEAYYRRIDVNVRDSSQLQAQIAEDGGLSANDAAAVVDGIEFFTAAEAQTWMQDGTLDTRISAIAAVLTLSGRLNTVPDNPAELYTPEFIAKAASNTQTLIELVRADNPELADRLMGNQRAVTATVPDLTPTEIQEAPDIGNLEVRGEVSFTTGSAQLTTAGQQTLVNLAGEIKEFSQQTVAVRVIGHTSRTGSAAINQQLSQQRAQVVVDYLRNQGIQHNIVAEGKGFNEPLPNISPEDARNQRTEIRLVRVGNTAQVPASPTSILPGAGSTVVGLAWQSTDWAILLS